MKEICGLGDTEMRDIAAALRAGRIAAPFSAMALKSICADRSVAIAEEMQRVFGDVSPDHAALTLEAIAADREHRKQGESSGVELVWTGPEMDGAANRDTRVVAHNLFLSAREHVLISGFAFHGSKEIFEPLAGQMKAHPNLKVQLFLNVHHGANDTTKPQEALARFATQFRKYEWPWESLPEVYYDPRSQETANGERAVLHAKCIVVDRKTAFVTSANFTTAAHEKNIEVGVLVNSPWFASQLVDQFQVLAERKKLLPLSLPRIV
jgi:phosphatidylserine/phosphatidylglycerophosphate/cardiolipin synthase-like enzyme